LRANAAAVIFAHNHPLGVAQPSQATNCSTRNLKTPISLVDIKSAGSLHRGGPPDALFCRKRSCCEVPVLAYNSRLFRMSHRSQQCPEFAMSPGQKPIERSPGLAREQQDHPHLPAQPALPPLLAGDESRWVRLRVSTSGLRRIDKLGLEAVLAEIKAKKKAAAKA
jgi:hypothetical protein